MEQLFITRKMQDEMTTVLKKHEGHASRVIGDAMNDHGVDENVYHKKSIDGNHCLAFGDKGTEIVDQITKEMREVIKDEKNIEYLEKLDASLKEILGLWFKLMKVMKSVRRQSLAEIAQFKADTIALNKAIHKFVDDEPVPGTGNGLPEFLKSHLLFDYHIQDFLELWETLGGFDEQSMESTHPEFNQLLRRYGNTRGQALKIQVVHQFLFERVSFVVEMIDEMLAATSRTKRPDSKKRGPKKVAVVVSQEDINQEGFSDKLSKMEIAMNSNARLHPPFEGYSHVDTCISACEHCGKRLLNFYAPVHYHEYHSGSISSDLCDGVAEKLKEEAAY